MAGISVVLPSSSKIGRSFSGEILIWVLFAYALSRCVTTEVEYLARRDIILICSYLLVFFLVKRIPSEWLVAVWGWATAILALLNAIVALYQVRVDPEFCLVPGYRRIINESRAGGLFNNPNHFASFMILAAGILSILAILGIRSIYIKIIWLFVAFCFFDLVWTWRQSRWRPFFGGNGIRGWNHHLDDSRKANEFEKCTVDSKGYNRDLLRSCICGPNSGIRICKSTTEGSRVLSVF